MQSQASARSGADTRRIDTRSFVLTTGLCLVAAAVALRAWGTFSGWFYFDDYVMLAEAQDDLDLGYVLQPYHNQFMPGGRVLVWVVAHAGSLQWPVAATLTVILQAAASLSALWMLVTLFGPRLGILAPLTLYLTSALTLPATLWWAAALNQLPMQIAFFAAVSAWVTHLRRGSRLWLLVTVGAVSAGLLFYVKALLVLPVLAFLAIAYFEQGTLVDRLRAVVRGRPMAVTSGLLLGGAYVAYYVANVREPFESTSGGIVADLAGTMIGTAFGTAVLGGPWQWAQTATPTAIADPPSWSRQLAWILIVLVVLYAFLRRRKTLRAWGMLAFYLSMLLLLVAASRATVVGPAIGLEYRYLTDAACALALCVGLAFMPLVGAVDPSADREEPLLAWRAPTTVVAALVGTTAVLAVASSVRYIDIWTSTNQSREYVENLEAGLAGAGPIDLADEQLPREPSISFEAKWNRVSTLASLVSSQASFPDVSDALAAVADDGTVGQALIELGVAAKKGPRGDCGWLLRAPGGTIPLQGRAFDNDWWVRVGYLASATSDVELTTGPEVVRARLDEGPNTLFFRTGSMFQEVRFSGLSEGTSVCVTELEVGEPVAGGPLP